MLQLIWSAGHGGRVRPCLRLVSNTILQSTEMNWTIRVHSCSVWWRSSNSMSICFHWKRGCFVWRRNSVGVTLKVPLNVWRTFSRDRLKLVILEKEIRTRMEISGGFQLVLSELCSQNGLGPLEAKECAHLWRSFWGAGWSLLQTQSVHDLCVPTHTFPHTPLPYPHNSY